MDQYLYKHKKDFTIHSFEYWFYYYYYYLSILYFPMTTLSENNWSHTHGFIFMLSLYLISLLPVFMFDFLRRTGVYVFWHHLRFHSIFKMSFLLLYTEAIEIEVSSIKSLHTLDFNATLLNNVLKVICMFISDRNFINFYHIKILTRWLCISNTLHY